MDLHQPHYIQQQKHSFSLSIFTRKQRTHLSLLFFLLLVLTSIVVFSPSRSLTSFAFFSPLLPIKQNYSTTFSTIDINELKSCDYSNGEWVRDQKNSLRLYTEQCPFLDPGFRCRRNGRSDVDYLNWRWQPKQCHLPRYMSIFCYCIIRLYICNCAQCIYVRTCFMVSYSHAFSTF